LGHLGEETLMQLMSPLALLLLFTLPVLVAALVVGRRRPGVRRILPLAARIFAIVALTLVVAGLRVNDADAGVDVVFAVDLSDSISPEGRTAAREYVERALASADEGDRAAIVLIGEDIAVERSMQEGLRGLSTESELSTQATSIADGILRSLSLFDGNRPGRIVLLSDGQETRGDAAEAARVARSAGVEILTVPLEARPSEGEVFVRRVEVPAQVRVDETHEFTVNIAATDSAEATVSVFRDGEYYGQERLTLGPGDNLVSFQGRFETTGVHRYSVTVSTADDPIPQNNEAEALVRVTGEPSVLYVSSDPARPVIDALRSQGIRTEVRTTNDMPDDIGGLVPYEAVIFDNVAAYDMSVTRMEAVERYVRDTGGGFMMIGGDSSFGAGGYYNTPIERVLPVDMDMTSALKIPSLSMVFVIDKSGSMGAMEASGSSKLDLVKEAVVAAVEIMNPFYTVGLIAFDADWEWTVPITRAGDRGQIIRDLAGLSSGGGTVLEGALRETLRALREEEAAVKHLVVLSDGLTNDADFEGIIRELTDESITVSTVSIGSSSDRELMRNMADWGGGRSYHATDTKSVPTIFAAETTIVSRNLIVEEPFIPRIVTRTPIVEGIEQISVPPLEGFVLSYQKNGAQLVLAGEGDNPVLSSWQYGLGRSIAFTSDLRAKWADNWLDWEGYQQIIAQAVRWMQRPAGVNDYAVRFETSADRTNMVVDAFETDGSYQNLLDLTARIQPPGADPYETPLVQTRPGRYEVEFPSRSDGNYIVTLYGDADSRPEPYGFSVPFGLEYIQFQTNFDLLELIAQRGGGTMVSPQNPEVAFGAAPAGSAFRDTVWQTLLIVAISLLVLELLLKKLILPIGTIAASNVLTSGTSERAQSGAGNDTRQRERIQKTRRREEQEEVPSYSALREQVADAYRRESKRPKPVRWYEGGEHNPVAERKIYIARKRKE
jgi:Mg-chelatase subunit ChlD